LLLAAPLTLNVGLTLKVSQTTADLMRGHGPVQQIGRYEDEAEDVVGFDTAPLSELVRSASNGEKAAWIELLARFGEMITEIGRAHRLSSSEIDHLRQTTWLSLVQNFDRIEDPELLGDWLAETARRETQRLLRHVVS